MLLESIVCKFGDFGFLNESISVINEINTVSLMFVATAVAIPRYLVIENLGIINTFWAHILPALALPVGLFLIKQNIDQIPDEVIEAAVADGLGGINEAIELAATSLSIIPLLIIYFIAQRWFVDSIDKSGITGE